MQPSGLSLLSLDHMPRGGYPRDCVLTQMAAFIDGLLDSFEQGEKAVDLGRLKREWGFKTRETCRIVMQWGRGDVDRRRAGRERRDSGVNGPMVRPQVRLSSRLYHHNPSDDFRSPLITPSTSLDFEATTSRPTPFPPDLEAQRHVSRGPRKQANKQGARCGREDVEGYRGCLPVVEPPAHLSAAPKALWSSKLIAPPPLSSPPPLNSPRLSVSSLGSLPTSDPPPTLPSPSPASVAAPSPPQSITSNNAFPSRSASPLRQALRVCRVAAVTIIASYETCKTSISSLTSLLTLDPPPMPSAPFSASATSPSPPSTSTPSIVAYNDFFRCHPLSALASICCWPQMQAVPATSKVVKLLA
ncbi:hypothetical protein CVT26_011138 [Gymnopilus dilepis]|uniref:Uncharacterized protein n=1 Tax=Gymnopilus dilepis TaxID=231916 RepID=A0A409VYY7_9AGAR|nr:hypothetical protein CVT26_011138 [Gymnopilus dilepis]